MQTLLLLYLASGLLISLISLPLIWQKVKPNWLYGFRVKATLNNPDIWYPANRYAGKWLFVTGLIVMVSALGLYLFPGISTDHYAWACLFIFTVVLIIGLIKSFQFLKKLQG